MLTPSDYHEGIPIDLDPDETSGTYTLEYEWSRVRPSTAIMEAVSAIEGKDPIELEPLGEFAEPEAIDELLTGGDPDGADLTVSFRYGRVDVSAGRDGEITLRPVEDTAE